MPDVSANITLTTTGGDQAASEILKADTALKSVTSSSSGLEHQFQHRFQHIGLMLFAGDAIKAAGLGNETRGIINLLNQALMAGSAAGGLASGGIMLLVAAFAALVGIASKVIEKHKDITETLEKISETNKKAIESTDQIIEALKNWKNAAGQLTPALENLLRAEERLRQEQIKSQELTNQELIASLNKRIAAEIDMQGVLERTIALEQQHVKAMDALKPGMQGYTMLEREVHNLNDATKQLDSTNMKLLTDQAKLNQVIAQQINLHHGVTASIKTQSDAEVKSATEAAHKQEQAYKKMWALRIADARAHYKELEKQEENFAKMVVTGTSIMTKAFSTAFAESIVEGKDFQEGLNEQFKGMAERFIEYVIEMMVVWAALKALMMMFGGPGIAAFKTAAMSAYPGLAQMGLSEAVSTHAIGGSVFADRPTMAIFGEGGPETATFTPMGGGTSAGGGGGSGTNYFGPINVNVSGVNDPKKIADAIGQEIVRSIRGQGQLNFTRG